MNYSSIGVDINPFSCMLSEVKTNILFFDMKEILNCSNIFKNDFSIFQKIHQNSEILLNFDIIKKFFVVCYVSALSDERYLKIDKKQAYFNNLDQYLKTINEYLLIKSKLIEHQPKTHKNN